MSKKGIGETTDLVLATVALGNALGESLKDKKCSWADIGNFVKPLTLMPAALAGISEVPSELADLDAAEKGELLDRVQEEFDLDDEQAEVAIEEGLALAAAIHSYVTKVFAS